MLQFFFISFCDISLLSYTHDCLCERRIVLFVRKLCETCRGTFVYFFVQNKSALMMLCFSPVLSVSLVVSVCLSLDVFRVFLSVTCLNFVSQFIVCSLHVQSVFIVSLFVSLISFVCQSVVSSSDQASHIISLSASQSVIQEVRLCMHVYMAVSVSQSVSKLVCLSVCMYPSVFFAGQSVSLSSVSHSVTVCVCQLVIHSVRLSV